MVNSGDHPSRDTHYSCRRPNIVTVKNGAIFAAGYTMVAVIPSIALLLEKLVSFDGEDLPQCFRVAIYACFCVYSLVVIASLALIAGIRLNQQSLFIPWLVAILATMVVDAATVVIHAEQTRYLINHQNSRPIKTWDKLFWLSYGVRTAFNLCALAIVLHQYKELKFQQARERLRRITLPYFADIKIVVPPAAIFAPPPYIDKPPSYRKSRPPSYRVSNKPQDSPDYPIYINHVEVHRDEDPEGRPPPPPYTPTAEVLNTSTANLCENQVTCNVHSI